MGDNDGGTSKNVSRRKLLGAGIVGGVIGATGAGTAAVIVTKGLPAGGQDNQVNYVGIENVAGPAPCGLPQIPIEIDSEGYLKGVWPTGNGDDGTPSMKIGNVTYSSRWFDYCDLQTAPGFKQDSEQDNYLRVIRGGYYDWQEEELTVGDKLHVDDFGGYREWSNGIGQSGLGKPAMATWRSEGVSHADVIPVQVLRSSRIEALYDADHPLSEWIKHTTQDGFIAWLSKCTDNCCIPAFKRLQASARYGGEDLVYCPCHASMYDPFTLTTESFNPSRQADT